MVAAPVACPYCNSHVSVRSPLPADRRLSCPRCGERFPYRGPEPETAVTKNAAPQVSHDEGPPTMPEAPQRWSNRAVAGTVLAVMASMVVLALTAALLTEPIRRAHDFIRPERRPPLSFPLILLIALLGYCGFLIAHFVRLLRDPSAERARLIRAAISTTLKVLAGLALGLGLLTLFVRLVSPGGSVKSIWMGPDHTSTVQKNEPPARVVAPAELDALGYLPPETNVVLAIHAAQAARSQAGKTFLERSRLGTSGIGMPDIEQATGLSQDQIDHLVVGVRLDDNFLPAPVLVLRTRASFDAARVRSALKARRRPPLGDKEVYEFELPRLKFNALLWCPNDRTLVVTIARRVLEKLPLAPGHGPERLAAPLQEFLRKRMTAGAEAWGLGHWKESDAAPTLLSSLLSADDGKSLAAVRTFGFWLGVGASIDLHAAIECADADAAQAVRERWQKRRGDGVDYFKVLGNGEAGELVSRELGRTLRVEQKDRWVTLEATVDAKTVRKAVERK